MADYTTFTLPSGGVVSVQSTVPLPPAAVAEGIEQASGLEARRAKPGKTGSISSATWRRAW